MHTTGHGHINMHAHTLHTVTPSPNSNMTKFTHLQNKNKNNFFLHVQYTVKQMRPIWNSYHHHDLVQHMHWHQQTCTSRLQQKQTPVANTSEKKTGKCLKLKTSEKQQPPTYIYKLASGAKIYFCDFAGAHLEFVLPAVHTPTPCGKVLNKNYWSCYSHRPFTTKYSPWKYKFC